MFWALAANGMSCYVCATFLIRYPYPMLSHVTSTGSLGGLVVSKSHACYLLEGAG